MPIGPSNVLPLFPRPRTRADCENGPRPCPWVSCRHHVALDVNPKTNSVKMHKGVSEEDDLTGTAGTCALDIADEGPHRLEQVADVLGVTRERVRQIEAKALRKLNIRTRSMFMDDDSAPVVPADDLELELDEDLIEDSVLEDKPQPVEVPEPPPKRAPPKSQCAICRISLVTLVGDGPRVVCVSCLPLVRKNLRCLFAGCDGKLGEENRSGLCRTHYAVMATSDSKKARKES